MDPINQAVRQFFADIEAYWLAHPGRALPIIAADDQRAFVAQALALREIAPDNDRAYFVFHERFTTTSSYFYGLAKAIAEQYERLRTAVAYDGVELPPFAGEPSTMPSGPVEYAARAMERVAQLFEGRLDGIVVALIPEHIAAPKAWREVGRALAARRWSQRARVAVLAPPGGPLHDIEGVRFQFDAGELLDHCAEALGMSRSRRRRRQGLVVALAQIDESIASGRGAGIVKPPSPPRPVRHVAIPEINAMRELRQALARGGLSPIDTRTPEGSARVAAFYVMVDIVRLLVEFKSRIEAGESCRLVQVKRSHGSGRLVIEIAIQEQP